MTDSGRHQEQAHPGLIEGVLELVSPVGRVDVDEDGPDAGGRVLGDDPLVPVGRPHPDPVPLLDAHRHQPAGHLGHLVPELLVGHAYALVAHHEGEVVGPCLDGAAEVLADALSEQRDLAGAVNVGKLLHRVAPPRGWAPRWVRAP